MTDWRHVKLMAMMMMMIFCPSLCAETIHFMGVASRRTHVHTITTIRGKDLCM
ncbi:hypothetical protein M758_10G178900 [Ceratodon purpureus]|uniref:Uncharacterized protein n=1 Tax=Ceratodon purpureus TaxID=3225 RepID=A0A8T0GS33_CERPU|nr:hypothetical protein KC19_10G183500 [Ceratodon purpureus]KAG0604542.1 hypothetical protein M758_10G178900 [Ceratodon purpureus]